MPHEAPSGSGRTMDPLGAMQAFGDFWTNSSRAFFEGQQKWFGDLAKVSVGGKPAFTLQPDTSGFEAAQRAYAASFKSAMDLSAALMKGLAQVADRPTTPTRRFSR
jgi:hypothetical protein